MTGLRFLALMIAVAAQPVAAQTMPGTAPLTDPELAQATGKFILPNGVEIALTITSDTLLNGQALLRTVLSVDRGATLTVYGRQDGAPAAAGTARTASSPPASAASTPTGIAVAFDRHSGLQTITPTYAGTAQARVSLGGAATPANAPGLERLLIDAGGPAVRTNDGLVSVDRLANGALVTLTGDHLQASHLVGSTVATALANSGDNRTFDTGTTIAVDLRNAAPYQIGAAALRADALALDATRSLMR
jgi:hypothetical protein